MINKISINGMRIGDLVTEDMKNLVLDFSLPYKYDHVFFAIDSDNKIKELAFYSKSSSDGTSYGIEDVQIEYEGNKLTTIDDFNNLFGQGQEEIFDNNYRTIEYNNSELILTIVNDIVVNVRIRKEEK